MQPKRIIRCRHVRCDEDMLMNGTEVKVAVCNGIEDVSDIFQKNIKLILEMCKVPGVLKIYENANSLLAETVKQDIIFYLLKASPEDELEIVGGLKRKHKNSKIIFVAQDGTYLKEAYKAQPFRYLYLSDAKEEIQEAIVNAIKNIRERKVITLEESGRYYYILLKDILYIEALGDDIGILTTDGIEYILRMPLKQIYQLTEYEFIKCNRQQIVNARYILSLERAGVMLVNDVEIRISGRERKNVVERYAEYVFKMRL